MHKRFSSLLWLLVVIALSALVLSKLEDVQERRERQAFLKPASKATVLLVGYADEEFPGAEDSSLRRIGCDEVLVPTEMPVVSKRLKSILSGLTAFEPPPGLHNPLWDKGLSLVDVYREDDGTVVVEFSGQPRFGGLCDTPRLKAQVEETLRLYADEFEIRLNGSAKEYECMGDRSGKCR